MYEMLRHKRDFLAGGLMILLGLGTIFAARDLDFGTMETIGPGVMPLALGVVLTLLGVLIAGSAAGSEDEDTDTVIPRQPQWRGWICVIGGPLLFILFGHYGGLIPATFACVFVASLGDRAATLKSSLVLATGITVAGYVVFSYALGVQLPAWSWTLS